MNPSIRSSRSSRESEASKDREEELFTRRIPSTSEAQQSPHISLEDIEIGALV